MYKIILSDGTALNNLTLNGNNFIAEGEIDSSVFDGKLETVTISSDTGEISPFIGTYSDMVLLGNTVRDGKSWLVFGVKSEEEKREETVNANFTDLQMALAEVYEMIIGA